MSKTIQRMIVTLLVTVILISALPVTGFALTAEEALDYLSYEITDGEVTITGCDESISGDVTIPSTIEEYPVTSIGDYAFYDRGSLISINIPDSVTSIGEGAFIQCSSLKSITVDESNGYYSSDEYGVLYNKDKTELIQYPAGNSRKAFTIPDSVTSIGKSAFYKSSSLVSVIIGNSVTSIGDGAFEYCSSLTSITIPDSVTSIGNDVLTQTAFYNDKNNWDNDALYIGKHLIAIDPLFNGVLNVKDGTKYIADSIFWGTYSLTKINIPDSVCYIGGQDPFFGCPCLERIDVSNDNKTFSSDSYGVLYNKDKSELIRFTNGNKNTSYQIPETVTKIGNYAFSKTTIKDIIFPDTLKEIGSRSFENCPLLVYVSLPNSIEKIGGFAFSCCTGLSNINIPENLTTIEDFTFDQCFSLKTIILPEGLITIGNGVFSNCTSLESIDIPNTVKSIGRGAFSKTSLVEVSIPDSVTSIGDVLFSNCKSLVNVTLSKNIRYIPFQAFFNCSSLESISLPYYTTEIEDSSFKYCESLKNVYIPGNVTSIGDYAFYGCKELKNVTLQSGLKNIGLYAFGFYRDTEGNPVKTDGFTLYCWSNSTAMKYAIDNGFNYELLNNRNKLTLSLNLVSETETTFVIAVRLESGYFNNIDFQVVSNKFVCNTIYESETLHSFGGSYVYNPKNGKFAMATLKLYQETDVILFYEYSKSMGEKVSKNDITLDVSNCGTEDLEKVVVNVINNLPEPEEISSYTVTFNANNGNVDESVKYILPGQQIGNLPTATRKGYTFDGWFTALNNGIEITENTIINSDTIYYAHWTANKYTVKFYDSAILLDSKVLSYDETGTLSCSFTPEKKGYVFVGWSTVENGPALFEDGIEIKNLSAENGSSVSYYSVWEKLPDKDIKDESTGIQVNVPGGTFDGDVTLKVEEVLSGSSFDIIGKVNGKSKTKVFTIETYVDGQSVQPNGDVTVRIPVPDGFNAEKCKLYYLNTSSKNPEEIAFRVEDGYIVFITNHFSDWAIIQTADMPTVSVNDIGLNYKKSAALNPSVTVDENASYTVTYTSSNPSVARVDENGKVYGAKKGSAEITVTVTDEYGNNVSDTCKVNVTYAWWQWIIVIVLFGWIWY